MKQLLFFLACCSGFPCLAGDGGTFANGTWQGRLHRTDGVDIVFNFEVKDSAARKVIYIRNAGERLLVDEVSVKGDSVNFTMPFFDSEFKTALQPNGRLEGQWIRHLPERNVVFPFTAIPHESARFSTAVAPAKNVSGRWATYFVTPKDTDFAVGEFKQTASKVTGTFLTTTGDYRFLEGTVSGDTLRLSTFDGSHAFVFQAIINDDHSLSEGVFYAGPGSKEQWYAHKDAKASLPAATALAGMRPGQTQLDFAFPALDGKIVSIKDPAFKGKVVIVTLLGSWCPNCMDENAYLAKWYEQNKSRGVAIIGLAYERTTDAAASVKALQPFIHRFGITYPLLLTGVTPGDPQKGEKTLPQLTGVKGFPTTIFIDREGNVKAVHTGFSGPGTGEHYETFKKEFNELVDQLLKQPLAAAN
ncbi:Peroxiredoxin [Chitinophaga costaii]|uniref:Peroxiredoxin n=1 Tax=Chitinophaga costaii TaxID=1335309 RepID=A0A1C4E8T2_9BACT|nr:TlpA disulfide reductase family protein [Chitinophaga costaii]PUZ24244.1 TlpA family protein disulfide reductase [Chitinophaga costaii]SCC39988.1 Peroxiredoxin [Chitinophaga costaii]